MDNNYGPRTLSGDNEITFNLLNITGDIEVNGNAGSAQQVLSKNSFNKLVWSSSTTHDDAGVGLVYNIATDKLDLNLNGLATTTTITQNDFITFHNNASGTDNKILNQNYIDPTLCSFFRTVLTVGDTAADKLNNHLWIQQIDDDGNRTLTKILIENFIDFVLSKFTSHGHAITFGNTVIIKPTLDAMTFTVEDNSGNIAFQYSAGPTRIVKIGNFINETHMIGNEITLGSDLVRFCSKSEYTAGYEVDYFNYLNSALLLSLGSEYVEVNIVSNLDGQVEKGEVTFLVVKDSIFKLNHIHEVSGHAQSNENLLIVNAGSLPYFKIFTDGGNHDLVVIDIHNRVSNFNLEFTNPIAVGNSNLSSQDFFKINHRNDDDNHHYGQIEMKFSNIDLATGAIDNNGGFKFRNKDKKIQFLKTYDNTVGLEYNGETNLLYINSLIDTSIIPAATSTYSLGSPSNKYLTVYCNSVVGAGLMDNPAQGDFLPDTTLAHNLGSSTFKWNEVHIGTLITDIVNSNLIPNTNDTHSIGSLSKVYTEIFAKTIAATANTAGTGGTLKSENLVIGRIGVNNDLFVNDRIILDTTTGLTKILPETNDIIELGSVDEKFKSIHSKLIDSDTTESKAFNFKNTAGTNCMYWDGSTGTFTGVNSTGAKSFEWDFTNQEFNFYHTISSGPFMGQRQVAVKIRTNTTSNNSPMQFNNLPTGSTGLNSGDLWVDTSGGYLKLA